MVRTISANAHVASVATQPCNIETSPFFLKKIEQNELVKYNA